MASDADYMNFLDKANQDPSQGVAKQQGGAAVEFKTTDSGAQVPEPLVAATKEAFYTSDADEPFVPVALGWEGGLPDEGELVFPSASPLLNFSSRGEWNKSKTVVYNSC